RMRTMAPSLGCPDQRRGGKHAVECVDGCAIREKHAHCIAMTGHCSTMQCGDTIVIFRVRIETARKHRLEDRSISAFRWYMHHEMMLRTKLVPQIGLGMQHCVRALTIARCTGRYKTF